MNRYTIWCTTEQVKKAIKLGAPIESQEYCPIGGLDNDWFAKGRLCFRKPTAEQMTRWLEEKNIYFDYEHPSKYCGMAFYGDTSICSLINGTYKEVTYAMIDIALDYLIKAKEEQI